METFVMVYYCSGVCRDNVTESFSGSFQIVHAAEERALVGTRQIH